MIWGYHNHILNLYHSQEQINQTVQRKRNKYVSASVWTSNSRFCKADHVICSINELCGLLKRVLKAFIVRYMKYVFSMHFEVSTFFVYFKLATGNKATVYYFSGFPSWFKILSVQQHKMAWIIWSHFLVIMHKVNIITLKVGERERWCLCRVIKIRGHFVFPPCIECFFQSDSPEAEHCNVSMPVFLPWHIKLIYSICQHCFGDYHWVVSCSEGIC